MSYGVGFPLKLNSDIRLIYSLHSDRYAAPMLQLKKVNKIVLRTNVNLMEEQF